MQRNLKIAALAALFWFQTTASAWSQITECQSYKVGKTDRVTLHKRSFADEVICPKDTPVCPNRPFKIKGLINLPENALGPPEHRRRYGAERGKNAYSLGCNAYAIWKFTDNVIVDVEGPDIVVFEAGPAKEPTTVEISRDGVNWRIVGVVGGGEASIDIASHVAPGEKLRYIKLTDLGASKCSTYAGADIKAIATYAFSQTKTEDESSGIFFDVARSVLKPHGWQSIDHIFATNSGERHRLEIEGHTDSDGRTNDNQALSENRANAVKQYIISKGYMGETRVRTFGAGELRPTTSNATEEGRAKNRRVELTFIPLIPCR